MRTLIILLSLTITTIACNKEDNKNYDSQNEADIQKYLVENNIDAEQTESGLYYVIDKKGDGRKLNNDSCNVIVNYKLKLLNGELIDETKDYGHAFGLGGGVIPGFSEGVKLFNEGGEGTLIIPSRLAYGNHSIGKIPAGSVLVFDIKILSTEASIDSINNDQIKKYLHENKLKADSSETGLYYIIDSIGTKKPNINSSIKIKYKGYFLNGDIFDENKKVEGDQFTLRNLIPGFKEGILLFNEGDYGTLIIPSKLGYGFFGRQPIPPGAVIIFDVELVKVY